MRERYFVSLAVAILVQHDVVPFFSSPEGAPFSSAATSPAASVSAPAPARGDVTGAAPAERYPHGHAGMRACRRASESGHGEGYNRVWAWARLAAVAAGWRDTVETAVAR